MGKNMKWEADSRADWISELVSKSGANGVVLGLSGGKDSAVVAALCKRAKVSLQGFILSMGNSQSDEDMARLLGSHLDISVIKLDLLDEILLAYGEVFHWGETGVSLPDKVVVGNLKARIRMTLLYTYANQMNLLVAGTGNKSEASVGYFTKWGDGAYDFNPIGDLTYTEVHELARVLEIPEKILERPSSAGLWEGQTDEDEMGVSYKEIDDWLMGREVAADTQKLLQKRYLKAQHKLRMPYCYPDKIK